MLQKILELHKSLKIIRVISQIKCSMYLSSNFLGHYNTYWLNSCAPNETSSHGSSVSWAICLMMWLLCTFRDEGIAFGAFHNLEIDQIVRETSQVEEHHRTGNRTCTNIV